MTGRYRPGRRPARPVAYVGVIDIAHLLADNQPAEIVNLPHHVHALARVCGGALAQVDVASLPDGLPGHVFTLSRAPGSEQLSARYGHLNSPGRAGKADAVDTILAAMGDQYAAGEGPFRRDDGEQYLALALIVRGYESVAPQHVNPTVKQLHDMVASGEAKVVMRGVGLSVDGYRVFASLTPEVPGVQGWLIEPGEPWPETNDYVRFTTSLHERLLLD